VSLVDHACKELSPGEIAFRTMDQVIIIGCGQADLGHSSAVWMADLINVFAQALTDLTGMYNTLPARFQVSIEVQAIWQKLACIESSL
jgi:predicted Rdx family selenoprotein